MSIAAARDDHRSQGDQSSGNVSRFCSTISCFTAASSGAMFASGHYARQGNDARTSNLHVSSNQSVVRESDRFPIQPHVIGPIPFKVGQIRGLGSLSPMSSSTCPFRRVATQ